MPIKDPEARKKYLKEWRLQRRNDFFKDKSCRFCGSIERLELDHINPADKLEHRIWTWRESRRLAEIAKCQVLCRICHQKKTTAERGQFERKHGSTTMYRFGCRCDLCKEVQSAYIVKYAAKRKLMDA